MIHDIRVQAWGRSGVLVCVTCAAPGEAGRLLLRAEDSEGIRLRDMIRSAEDHLTDMAAAHLADIAGEKVEGQTTVNGDELLAFGPPESYPAGYHQRTGQKIEPEVIAGRKYLVKYLRPGQRLPRYMVAQYLETIGTELKFSGRPQFGTATIQAEWIQDITQMSASSEPYADRKEPK